MPRPKKPTYEYVEKLQRYRKRIKDADGKYVSLYAKTPDELTDKIREVEEAIARKQEDLLHPFVADYAEQWLRLHTADMSQANSTLYHSMIRNHVVPVIGHLRLSAVKPDDAKTVMVRLASSSASLQSKVLNTMRKMFDNAVDNDLLQKNPCAKLKNNGYRSKQKTALTADQQQTLREAVAGTRAEPFVLLGLYTGMRREEILGLQWDCVKLNAKAPHVIVNRALRWEHNRPVVDEILKSDAARRTIPIPAALTEYLSRIQKPSGHVVGGDPLTQTQFKNLWKLVTNRMVGEKTYSVPYSPTKEKATFIREPGAKSRGGNFCYTIDFEVTPHLLRHTYITELIMAGCDVKTVQYLAGHADVKVTLDIYTHLRDKSPDRLMSAVNMAFGIKNEVNSEASAPQAV